ncbi:MAG TPA: hypothetical protein VL283_03290 [Candidatus Baltobacteraceae bacterium]|nr:hypothetical protein [Candidatus Baltobacteraceae bacterium]
MKKLGAKEVYALANVMFQDSHDLASFNLLVEIHEGLLVPDDPDAAPPQGAQLAGIMGYVGFDEMLWVAQAIGEGELDDDDDAVLVDGMKRYAIDLPHLDETLPPSDMGEHVATGLAALAAWRAEDGTMTYIVYRHPVLDRSQAYGLLKEIAAGLEAEMIGAVPSRTTSPLPGN